MGVKKLSSSLVAFVQNAGRLAEEKNDEVPCYVTISMMQETFFEE